MPLRAPAICNRCQRAIPNGQRCACAPRDRSPDNRPSARQRGYSFAWEQARAAFLREHPQCVRCKAAAKVVDHVIPHRGDQSKFWEKANWQPLCTACHARGKQIEEHRGVGLTKGIASPDRCAPHARISMGNFPGPAERGGDF